MTLVLDCLSNPRNLGNLLRLACAVGADVAICGSILGLNHDKVRSQLFTWLRPGDPITFADLAKRVRPFDTFAQDVEHYRAQGRRIIGTSPLAEKEHYDVRYAPNDVLAFGHEEGGLGRIKLGLCDLRTESPTYKTTVQFLLGDPTPARLVIIPPGVAHGCKVIQGPVNLLYLTSHTYDPADELRIPYDSPEIDFDWKAGPPIS